MSAHPLRHVALRREPDQRERQPFAHEPCAAEREVGSAIELLLETRVAEAQQIRRPRLIRRPDDRARAVGEGQEGERAIVHEALPGGGLVVSFSHDVCDDGRLSVGARLDGETRRTAHRRLRAVGSNDQASRQRAARRTNLYLLFANRERSERFWLDVPAGLGEGCEQCHLQRAVLGDVPEVRLTDVCGVEYQHRGARGRDALVPDTHTLVS